MTIKTPRPLFAAQNFHGHTKEFLRKVWTIWAPPFKNVLRLCRRPNLTAPTYLFGSLSRTLGLNEGWF
jgi:hypothetical protein